MKKSKAINSKFKCFNIILFLLPVALVLIYQLYDEQTAKGYCIQASKGKCYDQDQEDAKTNNYKTNAPTNTSSNRQSQKGRKANEGSSDDVIKRSKLTVDDDTKTEDDNNDKEKISCLNENGDNVDWFFNLKLPGGLEFMAYNRKDKEDKMKYFEDLATESAVKKTLDQFYGHESDFLSVMFNDHRPDKKNADSGGKLAYAKGVLHCKNEDCYFIQHSWPKFPPSSHAFKSGSPTYGQHFFCVSLSLHEADSLFDIFYHIRPNFYDKPPKGTTHDSEWLQNIVAETFLEKEVRKEVEIHFSGGLLRAFLKNEKSDDVIWNELAKEYANIEFDITSWLNGPAETVDYDEENPFCTVIMKMLKEYDGKKKCEWGYGLNHSKIAVSRNSEVPVICFGDLNFAIYDGQMRAGAIYCYENQMLYTAFKKTFNYDAEKESAEAIRFAKFLCKKKK